MMNSVATANRIAGGYVATPNQPAIVVEPAAPRREDEQHDARERATAGRSAP